MIASFDLDKALQELRRVPAQLNSQSPRPATKRKYVESKSDKLRAEDQKSGDGNEP